MVEVEVFNLLGNSANIKLNGTIDFSLQKEKYKSLSRIFSMQN